MLLLLLLGLGLKGQMGLLAHGQEHRGLREQSGRSKEVVGRRRWWVVVLMLVRLR